MNSLINFSACLIFQYRFRLMNEAMGGPENPRTSLNDLAKFCRAFHRAPLPRSVILISLFSLKQLVRSA